MAPCNEMLVVKALLNKSPEFQASREAFSELKAQLRMQNAVSNPAQLEAGFSLRNLLPDRQTCERWTAQYLATYGRIYCILDPSALAEDTESIYAGTLDKPVRIARLLLVIAIAMQNDESSRLSGRRLARHIEDCVHSSSRFQKPCISVVQVLLLLMIMKTISASDTDKMYDIMAVQGLTSQITSSMGLHRDPSLFPEVTPYDAELRKRIWSCFVRLNLDYCVRSGTQLNLRLDDSDCPLPTMVSLSSSPGSSAGVLLSQETDQQTQADMAFSIASIKLAKIIAPMHQGLYAMKPRESSEMLRQLRESFASLVAELPPALRPGGGSSSSSSETSSDPDPIQELQKSMLSITMNSFLSILSLGVTLGTPVNTSQRSQLMEIWDYSTSVLHQFQSLCQDAHEISHMARYLLWTDAGRAALSACWVVGRLRRLDLGDILAPHHSQQQTASSVFQQLLTNSLVFLSHLWQGKFHLGPVAAKTSLILAVSLNVTLYLSEQGDGSWDDEPSGSNRGRGGRNEKTEKRLFDAGVAAAERIVADMRRMLLLQEQEQLQASHDYLGIIVNNNNQQQQNFLSPPSLALPPYCSSPLPRIPPVPNVTTTTAPGAASSYTTWSSSGGGNIFISPAAAEAAAPQQQTMDMDNMLMNINTPPLMAHDFFPVGVVGFPTTTTTTTVDGSGPGVASYTSSPLIPSFSFSPEDDAMTTLSMQQQQQQDQMMMMQLSPFGTNTTTTIMDNSAVGGLWA